MATVLIAVCAAIHIAAMLGEMFLWVKIAPKAAGISRDIAEKTAAIGWNQGLYNGFLAAGLIAGFFLPPSAGLSLQVFCLICIAIAGLGAFATLRRPTFLAIQTAPAVLGLVAVWLGW